MTLALLLSGQGGQSPNMFELTADLPAAGTIFEAAAEHLGGRDPREVARGGSRDLHANRTGQILCVTAALAGWKLVGQAVPDRTIVAGYSVGDLAAWSVAGWMEPGAALDLAARRAEAMDAASNSDETLAGIRGLPLVRLEALAKRHGLHLAIRNGPDSVVVGGQAEELRQLCDAAMREGARRARLLDVRVASHTPGLSAATTQFRRDLERVPISRPTGDAPRLLAGLDGATVFEATEGLDKLARQISEPIDWAACLASCDEFGATSFLELGPGHALARMAETARPGRRVRSLEDFVSADGVRDWVSRTAA